MATTPKNRAHLAQLLNVSKGVVTRLADRGMPVDSLEGATAWRKANLDPARRKGMRFDLYRTVQARPAGLAAHAEALLELASAALQAGLTIDAMVPTLRAALAAVPPSPQRDAIGLPLAVANVLCADVLAVLPKREGNPKNDDGTPVYSEGNSMSDAEATEMGRFWFSVCAGEVRVTAP